MDDTLKKLFPCLFIFILLNLLLFSSCAAIHDPVSEIPPPYEIIRKEGIFSYVRFNYFYPSAQKVSISAWGLLMKANTAKMKTLGIKIYEVKKQGRCIAMKRRPGSGWWELVIPLIKGDYQFLYVINDLQLTRDRRIMRVAPDCWGVDARNSIVRVP